MLDERDLDIVAALQDDARATYADIAREVGLSPSSVHDRVRKLEQAGVIRAYRAIVDPEANQDQRYGLKVVRSLDEICSFDAVVITESRTPQKAYEEIHERVPGALVLAPPLLKITRDRPNLIAAAQELE